MTAGFNCYLLAAGKGTRAGGPKAWLEHQGKPLLERQLRFLRTLVSPTEMFVSIQPAWERRCAALEPEACWVSVDPETSPLSALQHLLRAGEAGRGFVWHVDMPFWEKEAAPAFSALAAAKGAARAPVQGGRRGHPIFLEAEAASRVLKLDPAKDRLDAFLRGEGTVEVPVDSPIVHANWNEGPR